MMCIPRYPRPQHPPCNGPHFPPLPCPPRPPLYPEYRADVYPPPHPFHPVVRVPPDHLAPPALGPRIPPPPPPPPLRCADASIAARLATTAAVTRTTLRVLISASVLRTADLLNPGVFP